MSSQSGNNDLRLNEKIEEAINIEVKKMCSDFDKKYSQVLNGDLSKIENLNIDKRINSILSDKDEDRPKEYNFRSFMQSSYMNDSVIEDINEKFEGDIYFCHKNKMYERSEEIINQSIEDSQSLEDLNRLAIDIIKNDNLQRELDIEEEDVRKFHKQNKDSVVTLDKLIMQKQEQLDSYGLVDKGPVIVLEK